MNNTAYGYQAAYAAAPAPYQGDAWSAYAAPAASYQSDPFSDIITEMMAEDPGFAATFNSLPAMPPPYSTPPAIRNPQREIHDVLRDALQHREIKKSGKAVDVTKRQIQALTKEHLYLIILDQDDEIQQLTEIVEKIGRAFQAGYAQGWTEQWETAERIPEYAIR